MTTLEEVRALRARPGTPLRGRLDRTRVIQRETFAVMSCKSMAPGAHGDAFRDLAFTRRRHPARPTGGRYWLLHPCGPKGSRAKENASLWGLLEQTLRGGVVGVAGNRQLVHYHRGFHPGAAADGDNALHIGGIEQGAIEVQNAADRDGARVVPGLEDGQARIDARAGSRQVHADIAAHGQCAVIVDQYTLATRARGVRDAGTTGDRNAARTDDVDAGREDQMGAARNGDRGVSSRIDGERAPPRLTAA